MASVFDELSNVESAELHVKYVDRIKEIYEYDATDIEDFLLNIGVSEDDRRQLLFTLRQEIFMKVEEQFPQLVNAELYSRRKLEILASDIYVLGNSVVNGLADKRFFKVIKKHGSDDINSSQQADPGSVTGNSALQTNTDLIQVCINLKDKVESLRGNVAELTETIASLKSEIEGLRKQEHRNISVQYTTPKSPTPGTSRETPNERTPINLDPVNQPDETANDNNVPNAIAPVMSTATASTSVSSRNVSSEKQPAIRTFTCPEVREET